MRYPSSADHDARHMRQREDSSIEGTTHVAHMSSPLASWLRMMTGNHRKERIGRRREEWENTAESG